MTHPARAPRSPGEAGPWPVAPVGALLAAPILALTAGLPARAHHLLDINGLEPTALNGLISGLLHPVIGPDHLLFLLALSLVGWRRCRLWMLSLLGVGLLGSVAGLAAPGLPGAELIVAGTLSLVAMVLWGWLPAVVLLPAMALHGYVLSASVVGWSAMPVVTYGLGLMLSQAALLLLALAGLGRLSERLPRRWMPWLGVLLVALSASLARANGAA